MPAGLTMISCRRWCGQEDVEPMYKWLLNTEYTLEVSFDLSLAVSLHKHEFLFAFADFALPTAGMPWRRRTRRNVRFLVLANDSCEYQHVRAGTLLEPSFA